MSYYSQWDCSEIETLLGDDYTTILDDITERDLLTEEEIEERQRYLVESESPMYLYASWSDFI